MDNIYEATIFNYWIMDKMKTCLGFCLGALYKFWYRELGPGEQHLCLAEETEFVFRASGIAGICGIGYWREEISFSLWPNTKQCMNMLRLHDTN